MNMRMVLRNALVSDVTCIDQTSRQLTPACTADEVKFAAEVNEDEPAYEEYEHRSQYEEADSNRYGQEGENVERNNYQEDGQYNQKDQGQEYENNAEYTRYTENDMSGPQEFAEGEQRLYVERPEDEELISYDEQPSYDEHRQYNERPQYDEKPSYDWQRAEGYACSDRYDTCEKNVGYEAESWEEDQETDRERADQNYQEHTEDVYVLEGQASREYGI